MFQKCELYWPQPREKTKTIKEEEEEEDGGGGRFGRFLLKVTDSQEKDGFTVTDMEIQVQLFSCGVDGDLGLAPTCQHV